MKKIRIYTDGGCDKNPGGLGAWAVRLMDGDETLERSGNDDHTTNNRMELTAAVRGLELLEEHLSDGRLADVEILSDSQYLIFGMNQWIVQWQLKGWKLKDGSPVKNVDLWKKMLELQNSARRRIRWIWVQGHAGDPHNMAVDRLVQQAMEKSKPPPPQHEAKTQASEFAPPQIKLLKQGRTPSGVRFYRKSSNEQFDVNWHHLQTLIEELLKIQIEGEEQRGG